MITKIDGIWSTHQVFITDDRGNRRELTTERSKKVINHSPGGFSWSYAGSGPAQLALAILLEFLDPKHDVHKYYQTFKFDIIANLPPQPFEMPAAVVTTWISENVPEEYCAKDECRKPIMKGEGRHRFNSTKAYCETCGAKVVETRNVRRGD